MPRLSDIPAHAEGTPYREWLASAPVIPVPRQEMDSWVRRVTAENEQRKALLEQRREEAKRERRRIK